MDKGKWIFAGVILGVVVIGSIVAAIVINKVAAINKLAKQ